jgi:two pore calcium channel protein
VVILLPNSVNDRRWLRFAALLRLLRLLRLVVALEQFRMIGEALNEILPTIGNVCEVLGCTFFFFSVVGIQIFGGKITNDETSPYYEALVGTDYLEVSCEMLQGLEQRCDNTGPFFSQINP